MKTHDYSANILIGAHTSASGGVSNALLEGQTIGATTIQFFTSNQKRWQGHVFSDKQIALWEEKKLETRIQCTMSHSSYLINLGSPKEEGLQKSRLAFHEEIERCHQLKVDYLNFHPGAALEGSAEECLDTIVESLKSLAPVILKGDTQLLLETTAGQGSTVGHQFTQLGYIISCLKSLIPIGVCMDTCHVFAAGYDIRSAKDWDDTLNKFDKEIGLFHLRALHVNDSLHGIGSKKDRHAPLGEGLLGLECFKAMMQENRLTHIPKYLETPGGPDLWEKEIRLLREFHEQSQN
ncbi:MAG: deoxyribonuclease IV [Rhabdochlamydiaceae bacterium]